MNSTRHPNAAAVAALPKIIAYTGMHDAGPADPRPNGVCPHCGAEGRYTYFFICDDGSEHGAMSGCIKLFPTSAIALAQKAIMDKQSAKKRLNGWDEKMLDAINGVIAGTMSEEDALRVIRNQQASRDAWMRRKFAR